jgi:L,D-transpeptidase YbiS
MKRAGVVLLAACVGASLAGAICGPRSEVAPPRAVTGEGRELFVAAEEASRSGDYDSALKLYQQLKEKYPSSPLAREADFRMGECFFFLGDSERAADAFKSYLSVKTNAPEYDQAQDYQIRILESQVQALQEEKRSQVQGCESRLRRLEAVNQSLRQSAEAEVIYLEMNLKANRLLVKMGTQTLHSYPIVSGKGSTLLRATGEVVEFDTPTGIRRIERIEKDPVWYRPDWYWLEKGLPVPENLTPEERAVHGTLGPYKLSFGEGFFIHGTRTGSIDPGRYSHGCVRMNNKDLLELVTMVEVGTLIYIY